MTQLYFIALIFFVCKSVIIITYGSIYIYNICIYIWIGWSQRYGALEMLVIIVIIINNNNNLQQWLRGQSFGHSTKRTQVWIMCCHGNCEQICSLYIAPVHSAVWTSSCTSNLAIYSVDICLRISSSCINCSVTECFHEKWRW